MNNKHAIYIPKVSIHYTRVWHRITKKYLSLPNCMCSNTARGLLHQDEKNIIGFFFLLYKNHCHEVILISSKSSAPSKRVSLKAIAFLNFHMHQQVACQIKCFHLRPFLPQINKPN